MLEGAGLSLKVWSRSEKSPAEGPGAAVLRRGLIRRQKSGRIAFFAGVLGRKNRLSRHNAILPASWFSSSLPFLPRLPWRVPEAAPFVSYGSIVDVSFLSATHGRVLRFVPGMATTAADTGHEGGPSIVRESASCRSSLVGSGFEVCRRRRRAVGGEPGGNEDRPERQGGGTAAGPLRQPGRHARGAAAAFGNRQSHVCGDGALCFVRRAAQRLRRGGSDRSGPDARRPTASTRSPSAARRAPARGRRSRSSTRTTIPTSISDANSFSSEFGLPQFNVSGRPDVEGAQRDRRAPRCPPIRSPGRMGRRGVARRGMGPLHRPAGQHHSVRGELELVCRLVHGRRHGRRLRRRLRRLDELGRRRVFRRDALRLRISSRPRDTRASRSWPPRGTTATPAGYPAFSPNVVAVGGTSLDINTSGSYLSESAWSDGGGRHQRLRSRSPATRSARSTGPARTNRTVPDVSMDADPNTGVYVLDSFDGGYLQVGGTSLATPDVGRADRDRRPGAGP